MRNDIHIFKPIRDQLGFWCGLLFLGILFNVYIALGHASPTTTARYTHLTHVTDQNTTLTIRLINAMHIDLKRV